MNEKAQKHVEKAKGFLAKGDGFYAKAADEMIAAQEADPQLSWKDLGAAFDRSAKWARDIVAWRTSGECTLPFSEPKGSVASRHAKKVLADAPLEQIEQILDQLPRDRRQAIGAAAKESWMSKRQDEEERIARRTPAEKAEADAAQASVAKSMRVLTGSLTRNEVVNDLLNAADAMREMIAREEVTPELMHSIEEAHDQFLKELAFAKALTGE